jgi:hypothetical protein
VIVKRAADDIRANLAATSGDISKSVAAYSAEAKACLSVANFADGPDKTYNQDLITFSKDCVAAAVANAKNAANSKIPKPNALINKVQSDLKKLDQRWSALNY